MSPSQRLRKGLLVPTLTFRAVLFRPHFAFGAAMSRGGCHLEWSGWLHPVVRVPGPTADQAAKHGGRVLSVRLALLSGHQVPWFCFPRAAVVFHTPSHTSTRMRIVSLCFASRR